MVWPYPLDVLQYARSSFYYNHVYLRHLVNNFTYFMHGSRSFHQRGSRSNRKSSLLSSHQRIIQRESNCFSRGRGPYIILKELKPLVIFQWVGGLVRHVFAFVFSRLCIEGI